MSTDEQNRELLSTISSHDELAREVKCRQARIGRWADDMERTGRLLRQRGSGIDSVDFPSSREVLREHEGLRQAEHRLETLKDRERQIRAARR